MVNKDNKTKMLDDVKLTNYISLLENNPIHIATVNKLNKPNLCVAADVKVLNDKTILISNNEMVHTPDNVKFNKQICLTCFNSKFVGIRMGGIAKYYTSGKYFKMCNDLFKAKKTTPKGAIVVSVKKIEIMA